MGTTSSHMLTFVLDKAGGTLSSAVASAAPSTGAAVPPAADNSAAPAAETALPVEAFADGRFSSPEGRTHNLAQQDGLNPYNHAKEQQDTGPQTISLACTMLKWLCSQKLVAVCMHNQHLCTQLSLPTTQVSDHRRVLCVGTQSGFCYDHAELHLQEAEAMQTALQEDRNHGPGCSMQMVSEAMESQPGNFWRLACCALCC